ncbi:MAG: ABC transporter ATP-binding protein [Candidatus Omnitrophota bacterium]
MDDKMMADENSQKNSIVNAQDLSKAFSGFKAVNGIDFSVNSQECLGFLGPNGAGKTTLIRMISCFLEPSGGTLEVFGKRTDRFARFIKTNIGVCPQEDNLDPDLKVLDNLRFFARYFDIIGESANLRNVELLEFMGLLHKKRRAD